MPLSERARLMDLVKFSGVVEGSRKSGDRQLVSTMILVISTQMAWLPSWAAGVGYYYNNAHAQQA